MPFSSVADLYSKIDAGKIAVAPYWKPIGVATGLNRALQNLFAGAGAPAAGTYSGSAGVATQLTRTNPGAIYLNGDVSTETRHLLSWAISSNSPVSGTPPMLFTAWLVDLLLYYPALDLTTPTTLDNTVTLPRYTDGKGVMAFVECTTLHTAAANVTQMTLTYTADDNSTGNVSPTDVYAPSQSGNLSRPQMVWQRNSVTSGEPFIALKSGTNHAGIKKVTSYAITNTNTAGKAAIVLCKPIAELGLPTIGTMIEKNYFPSLPQIYDGACLAILVYSNQGWENNVATDFINGHLKYVWG